MRAFAHIFLKSLGLLLTSTVLFTNPAFAQHNIPDKFSTRTSTDLLRQYQGSHNGTVESQELLIGILNRGLPQSEGNLKAVRETLAKSKSADEKVLLTRLLASMHNPGRRTQQNLAIEKDIKAMAISSDPEVAKAAVFEYSRLVYPPDRHELLQRARLEKILDNDAYFGELAHGLRFAPTQDQLLMFRELESANNQFAYGILASTFADRQAIDQLSPSAQTRLLKLLSAREPDFPLALDNFGLIDAIRYAFWINAVATIDAGLSGKPYSHIVLTRLGALGTDPRKILAVFANPEGKRVINETSEIKQLQLLLGRAQAFSSSLPQNLMLKDATAVFANQLRLRTSGGK